MKRITRLFLLAALIVTLAACSTAGTQSMISTAVSVPAAEAIEASAADAEHRRVCGRGDLPLQGDLPGSRPAPAGAQQEGQEEEGGSVRRGVDTVGHGGKGKACRARS